MALSAATRAQLEQEGISNVEDLADFSDEEFKQVADNLRRPGGYVADPNPNAAAGAMVPTPPFVFGAKSQMRLKVAAIAVRYYQTVDRSLTVNGMAWNNALKNFREHWKALCDRKKEDAPDIPKIGKNLVVTKWSEAFSDFLHRVIGVRTIPLAYVIRDEVEVPAAAPPLLNNQPFSNEHGSVEGELINRASHNHPLYREDNAQVYYYLEEATRSTSYSASIKPFQNRKDGRGAWRALIGQYAGEDKWRLILKQQDELLHTRKWKGTTSFSLEKFIGQHRNAFVSMSQCATHVAFQLPNELTRVTYLLDAIECNDAPLQAAMALVRNDTGPTGKMNDFEATASFLLPHDPVAKKRQAQGTKRNIADISSASSSSAGPKQKLKSGIGKTGVEFRFYKAKEYAKLTEAQKQELREYRDGLESSGKGRKISSDKKKGGKDGKEDKGGDRTVKFAKAIVKELKAAADEDAKPSEEEQLRKYILSVVNGNGSKSGNSTAAATTSSTSASSLAPVPPSILQSIVKRSKQNQN